MPNVELIRNFGLFLELYPLSVEGTIDPNCFGKELWRFIGFSIEK